MSRLAAKFALLAEEGRSALIPYITAGDPKPQMTVPLMRTLVESGANVIELGVPFSDPMADGPVIQRATERALAYHVSLHDVFDMVRDFRRHDSDTPVVLMGYLNPVEVMGYQAFAAAASDAGVDGVLTVDMPPEESAELTGALQSHGLDPIYLLAPTSHEARIRRIGESASGFVYYVALKGVTGAGHLDLASVERKLAEIRDIIDLPLGVGFGIKDAETAAKMARMADAVVVGSALVSRIEANSEDPEQLIAEVSALIGGMRQAMDAAS